MPNLNIPANRHSQSNLQNIDLILATVNSYDKHPGIERIKNRSWNSTFIFRKSDSSEVSKMIDNLNIKLACQNTKIIKPQKDIIAALIS